MNYYEILKNEPFFWTRIGSGANPDVRDENGDITFIDSNWKDYLDEHKVFMESGCRIQTTVIHSGWIGENEYDYSATDKTLDAIFSLGDDVLYLPRIDLNAPLEWLKANPLEIAISSYADSDPKTIAEVYKSFKTDKELANLRSGGVNKYGYYLQSFFSDKWLKDAKETFVRFIHHLENSKYADRIVGYQIGYGMCGELCNWGGWRLHEHWSDFSKNAQDAFTKYCIDKYGDVGQSEKTTLPLPEERHGQNKNIFDYFRVNNQKSIDFSLMLSERTAQNMCELAKVGKGEVNKPFGTFYGYLLTFYPSETGHLAIQKLIDCEYIDFISAPKIYYRCGAGEPGGSQATSMSVTRKKIWFDELDNDTHITNKYQEEPNHPKTFDETKTILWREVARNLAWNNQNFWWMDLYGGWFIDKEIQKELAKIIKFNADMRKKEYKSISEILFITDEKSIAYQTADKGFFGCREPGIINEMGAELKLCGAPVDEYRLEDLRDLDLSKYKMIVFANAFMLDEKLLEIIENIPKTTLIVWNYAAGVRKVENFSLSNTAALTGIEIAEYSKDSSYSNGYGASVMCPPLKICGSDNIEVIEKYDDEEIKTARRENHILSVSPGFFAEDFHRLAKQAGCRMYASAGCAVFADNRFTGVFPGKNGATLLELEKNGMCVDLISGKRLEEICSLDPKGAYIFVENSSI